MKKILMGGAMLLALVLGYLIFTAGSDPDDTRSAVTYTEDGDISVVASDGQAELIIPPEALPAEVSVADLAMVPIGASEVFGPTGDPVDGPAYRLLPDGAEFSEPVVVRITSVLSGDVLPTVLHKSGETVEFLTPNLFIIDPDQNTQTLAFEVTHFSEVGVDAARGLFHYRLEGGGEARVGETLPFILELWPDTFNHFYDAKGGYKWTKDTYTGNGFYYRFASGGWYDIDEWSIEDHDGVLTPGKTAVSGQTNLKEDDTYRYQTTLTCATPGVTNPAIRDLDLVYRSARQSSRESGWHYQNDRTYFFIYPPDYTCLDENGELPEDYRLSLDEEVVKVIEYGGLYLPVGDLTITDEEGCGAEHYHAPNGSVVATDGTTVPDPGPDCGYGNVSDFTVLDLDPELGEIEYRDGTESTAVRKMNGLKKYGSISLPNWRPDKAEEDSEEGEMRQVDPPTLTIPAATAE